VLEILVLLNNSILTAELVIISLFLVMLFVMLFVVGKRGFWRLSFLANAAHLLNLFYLMTVFGASILIGEGVLICLFGMLLCLSKHYRQPVRKPVTEVRVIQRKPEINRELADLPVDIPKVVKYPEPKFVASQSSEIFHRPECMWADNINEENKVFFDTKKDARKAGLRAHECVKKPVEEEHVPTGEYVASPHTQVYHKVGCEWADNIKNKNKIYFQSKLAAENAGYKPHTCLPGVQYVKKTYTPVKPIYTKKVSTKKVKPIPKTRFVASQNSEIFHREGCMWADNINEENKVFFDTKKAAKKAKLKAHECVKKPVEPVHVPTGDYVASPYTQVYHKVGCEWANNIKNKNKIYFKSKSAAANAGYKPHTCMPGVRKAKKSAKVRDVKKTYSPGKFIASKNSTQYHNPKCEWAKKINRKNRVWFSSSYEARKQGYRKHKCQ